MHAGARGHHGGTSKEVLPDAAALTQTLPSKHNGDRPTPSEQTTYLHQPVTQAIVKS